MWSTVFGLLLSFPLWGKVYSPALNQQSVKGIVTEVTNWQIKAYPNMDKQRYWKSHGDLSWENGVFLSALAEWAEFDQNETFIRWYENICERNRYQLSEGYNNIYYADDLAVALMYATLYEKQWKKDIIHPTVERLEYILNHPSHAGLEADKPSSNERWCWCDALYMAPPVFVRYANLTGNRRLLEFMDKEYRATYDFLFDKDEELFYRDSNYFGKKEKNGRKIFWGRGNAWVVGGLARMIGELPNDFSSKPYYEKLFQQMMKKLVAFQDNQGYWHASLLDPESYPSPETSGTAFYTYALWWGINNGLLEETIYLPYARKGWEALVKAVQPDGMLGWVQPVGADPKEVKLEMTEVYGPAGVMLVGKEIIIYLRKQEPKTWEHSKQPFSVWRKERIEEISRMLPDKPAGFGPTYKDRTAWEQVARKMNTKEIFEQANRINNTPMPAWDDEAYLEFSRNGVRPPGEKMLGARKGRLPWLVWAECIENKGTYVATIENTLLELARQRSWVLPAHDRPLHNFYGRRYHVELVSSLLAQNMAQALYMLDDKIASVVRQEVTDSIYSRVLNPTRKSLETGDNNNTWLYRRDNWNSVCLNGVTGTALFLLPDKKERAYYAAMGEYYSNNSICGFTDDGYCTEGIGYFNYGFENYLLLREELYQATQGQIDLFDNPKVKSIARYGIEFAIQNHIYPAFADCRINTQVNPYIVWYCNQNLHLGLQTEGNHHELLGLSARAMSVFPNTASKVISDNTVVQSGESLRKYFQQAGVLISRHPSAKGTLSVALKGGNNDENHNHNDVGTFVVVKGDEMLIGDAGGPYHYAGDMWTDRRYTFKTLSSYGHPVPVLNGECQISGSKAQAKVLECDFSDEKDIYALDLSSAYSVDGLKEIARRFVYQRIGNGSIEMEDCFVFEQPGTYETALITFGKWKLKKNGLEIHGEKESSVVKIIPPVGCTYDVSSEQLQENGPEMTRISIRLNQKIKKGRMKLIIQ